jgi:iron complex transport system ATP-binding protein
MFLRSTNLHSPSCERSSPHGKDTASWRFFCINRADKEKALAALELLDISNLAEQPYNQLSGGQRQIVLIARVISQETRIIFLDEPTSALDFSNQIRIWDLMSKIKETGITILACSRDPNHVSWFCDKVVVMNRSGIICQGPPHDVITESVLKDVYLDVCTVRSIDGVKMVLPRSVSARVGSFVGTSSHNR